MVGSGEGVVDSSTESVEGGKDALGVGVHSGWQADASQGLIVGLLGRVEVGEDGQEMRGESSTSTVGEFVDPEMPVGVLVNSPSENVSGRQQKKLKKGLTCSHCGALGINGGSKLLLHIDRMHSKPVLCSICNVEFADRFSFIQHSPSCFYWCPVQGCNYHEKRESRFNGHLRKHRLV